MDAHELTLIHRNGHHSVKKKNPYKISINNIKSAVKIDPDMISTLRECWNTVSS